MKRALLILLLATACFGQGLTLRSPLRDIAPAAAVAGEGITNGILTFWKLDDASGTSATDSSGNGHTLTLEGNAAWGAGHINGCIVLDGTGDDCFRTEANFLTAETDGTICGWFKTANTAAAVQAIFSTSDEQAAAAYFIVFVYSGQIYFTCPGTFQVHAGATGLANDTWHHFAVTSNGSTVAMFVDGSSQSLTVDSGSNTGQWFDNVVGPDNVSIGSYKNNGGYTGYLTGSIDDIKIFDRVLSGAEITAEAAR